MFFFTKDDGGEIDPSKMSAMEMAKKMESMITDRNFLTMVGLDINEAQYRKVADSIEKFVRSDKDTQFSAHSLISFKKGVLYGLGLGCKITEDARYLGIDRGMKDLGHDDDVMAIVKKFTTIFVAMDLAIKNWKDDKWLENLLENAVISEPKKSTDKNKKK